MTEIWGTQYTRAELAERLGDLRQLADVRPFEFTDGPESGTRGVSFRNAAGLAFRVLLERGMGLYDLQFRGVPVPFLTPAGAVHPGYSDPGGTGWLRSWPGGFLTPCGLTQVGSPSRDGEEQLGLHGRLASLPAANVSWGTSWQGEEYLLWVEGSMRESVVFGENLLLRRRIWTRLDTSRFWIEDKVENQGQKPSPHMFLQHINLGFPLVDGSTRLILPEHSTRPRDETASAGLAECLSFNDPIPDYAEQVFYHDLSADADGRVDVSLINPSFNGGQGLGMTLRYSKKQYPILVEWKMMRAGTYVVGLEPSNCLVEGRAAERASGRLQFLQPGEVRHYAIEVVFFESGQGVR
jgi:Domain of unknown function (DUF4432)